MACSRAPAHRGAQASQGRLLSCRAAERRSYVPDFVRRPDAYTCYELDEPLVVGGGDAAPVAAAQVHSSSNCSVACSASVSDTELSRTAASRPPAMDCGRTRTGQVRLRQQLLCKHRWQPWLAVMLRSARVLGEDIRSDECQSPLLRPSIPGPQRCLKRTKTLLRKLKPSAASS